MTDFTALKPLPKATAIVLREGEDVPENETIAEYLKWWNNLQSINETLAFVESGTPKAIMTPNFYNGLRGTRDGLVKEGYDKGFLSPAYTVKMDAA